MKCQPGGHPARFSARENARVDLYVRPNDPLRGVA